MPDPAPSRHTPPVVGSTTFSGLLPADRVRERLRTGRPLILGILNATPDSFSDGGHDPDRAVAHGCRLAAEGADIIDIGGESTRPGAEPPSVAEELDRVVPIIQQLSTLVDTLLSVDTSRPEVMRAAAASAPR